MTKFLFAFLLIVHGLIHLMGFAKAFQFAEVSELSQPISRIAGVGWVMACLLFLVAMAAFLVEKDSWWIWAAMAVLLSQVLIIGNWHDAKFGTIANVLVMVGLAIGFGQWQFHRLTKGELHQFLEQKISSLGLVTEAHLQPLPPIVQTWLRNSGVVGKPGAPRMHLWQTGEMRTSPVGKWMPLAAEQWFTANPPGFIWLADVRMLPFLPLAGRDKYVDGHGDMLVKLLSLLPVADSRGKEIDQGTLLRFLSEIVFQPAAALEAHITWESRDSTSATATMHYGGTTASGIFFFKENGDMAAFEADRYYNRKQRSSLERWRIEAKEWREMDGVRMPVAFEVTWKLKEGDFTWLKLNIIKLQYNENGT